MNGARGSRKRAARRVVGWALLWSFLIHLAAIVTVAWVYVLEMTPPPEVSEEIEITIIEPPPSAPPPTMFVDTTAPEAAPPENAVFESDRDTAAAAPEAAAGEIPLPTQDGREQPVLELEDTQLAMAQPAEAAPAPETPPSEPAPPVPPAAAEPAPEEPPEEKPSEPDALLAKAEPRREEEREPREESPPPAPPPSRPAFQRQARATRLRGSIDSTGRAAVASMATPLGRYRKAISDAIGSSWYYYIGSRLDMFSYGTVTVVFLVDKDGKVRRPRVTANTSNESFEIVTVESILSAEIPPIPPDVLPALEGGQIEIDYSFSIITN
jgi:outer membrane biosynthesis protein TonB